MKRTNTSPYALHEIDKLCKDRSGEARNGGENDGVKEILKNG
jgi:hypothetical protein